MKVLTLPRQSEWLLPLLAMIVLVLGGMSFEMDRRLPPPVWEGRDLVPGLDPGSISRIVLKPKHGNELELVREGEKFFIKSLNMAPVSDEKLNQLFLRLGGASIAGELGERPDWSKYQVAQEGPELTVALHDLSGKEQWKLYFGSLPGAGTGRPVRVNGKDEVFLTSEYVALDTGAEQYVERTAFSLDPVKTKKLEVFSAGKLIPEVKISREDFLRAFSPLEVTKHFRTGSSSSDLDQVKWDWQANLEQENGATYTISIGKKDERWFARAQASMMAPEQQGFLDIKVIGLKAEVDRFNQQKLPWVWEVSSGSIEKLKRGLKM